MSAVLHTHADCSFCQGISWHMRGSAPLGPHVTEVTTLPQLVRKAVLSTSFAQHAAALSGALWPIRSKLCMHCKNQDQH